MKPSAASCGNVSPVPYEASCLGVEHVRRAAAGDDGGVRPQLDAHLALDELLRLVDERVDRLARGAEPEALVDELRPALLEAALDPRLVLRQHDVLERRVRLDEHDRRRRLVDLAALDADGAVLDHVDPPDPVAARRARSAARSARRAAAPRRRARRERRPRSRSTTSNGAGAGADRAVSAYGSSGGAAHGSSSTPASIARPKRFSSIENGDACVALTGMPLASA